MIAPAPIKVKQPGRARHPCPMRVIRDPIRTNYQHHRNRQTRTDDKTSPDTHTIRSMVSRLHPKTKPRRQTFRSSRRRLASGGAWPLRRLTRGKRHNCANPWSDRQRVPERHSDLADAKGPTDADVVHALTTLCRGLGFGRFHQQCAQFGSSHRRAISRFIPRCAPQASKRGNGRIERIHAALQGITSTILFVVKRLHNTKIPHQHLAVSCAVRDAGWLRDRYEVGRANRQAPYTRSDTNSKNPGSTRLTLAAKMTNNCLER